MWNLPPPPGFQGLHPDRSLNVYLRHLPHWRQDGATYFVTFRLDDSLPQAKLRELETVRQDWAKKNPEPRRKEQLEELSNEVMRRVERWLDQGMGRCRLRERAAAKIVADALHYFDRDRYELGSYVVMPNHVHVIVKPLKCDIEPLESILQSWKRYTSRQINSLDRSEGSLWQEESFDRIIRDEEHLYRAIQYIGRNPTYAGLKIESCPLWISPAWIAAGWRFEPT